MKKTLAENMLRFGTKNLTEQTVIQPATSEINDPIKLVLKQLNDHSFRMKQMYDDYFKKYANSTADPVAGKRIALGMIKQIENAEKIYHDAINQVYNM